MSEGSKIEWTDHTFNPWWGCAKVSPGCNNCYASTFSKRVGQNVWGVNADRRFFGDKHWNEPLKWNEKAKAEGRMHLVFCASMADVFEKRPDLDEHRARLFDLIEKTEHLTWQLLTKRPGNILGMVPESWRERFPDNVWMGTSVEDQARANERVPLLSVVPAAIRFLSCEPLIGPVDLTATPIGQVLGPCDECGWDEHPECDLCMGLVGVHWVIVGGESGGKARRMDPEWVRSLRDQCAAADGVSFFFKQWGGRTPKAGGRELDGRTWDEIPDVLLEGAA